MSKTRSIFEDVATEKSVEEAPKGGLIDAGKSGARRAIAAWLMVLFALVASMIIVGGLTRLTDSGLSITEWKPITGAIPPTSEGVWQEEFAKYKENGWIGLGAWVLLLFAAPPNSKGLDGPTDLRWRSWWAARGDWLVDGVFWLIRANAGCGVLSACNAPWAGLCHPRVFDLVCMAITAV